MDTKKYFRQIRIVSLTIITLVILQGCPTCGYHTTSNPISYPGLIKITPLDSMYHQDDTIIISVRFPSRIPDGSVNNDTVDLYEATGIRKTEISGNLYKIIDPNEYEILEGEYDNYRSYVKYYDAVDEYRFKIRVVLNLIGDYNIFGGSTIEFPLPPPNPKCKRSDSYIIRTSIEGADTTGYIRFTVLP